MAQYFLSIAGGNFVAEYSAKVTFEGSPATGPTYASGGEQAYGPEFEVTVQSLHEDLGGGKLSSALEMPGWLVLQIEQAIHEDDNAVTDIFAEHRDRQEYLRDEAAERKREQLRDEGSR